MRRTAPRGSAASEVVAAYAYRSQLEPWRWWALFEQVHEQVDLLGDVLLGPPELHPELTELMGSKVAAGCRVRVVLTDGASQPPGAWEWLGPLLGSEGIEVRVQEEAVHSSLLRLDDQVLVTPHLFATPGDAAPLLHLRRLSSAGLFARFAEHFETVWASTAPVGADQRVSDPRR